MERDVYERIATNYDSHWDTYSDRTLSRVVDLLPPDLTGKNMIDIGCGTGTLIAKTLSRYPSIGSVTGVDISPGMLRTAKEKLASLENAYKINLMLQTTDIIDLPQGSFDIAVSTNVFHYFQDPIAKLMEIRGLLTENGVLLLEDCSKTGRLARHFEGLIKKVDKIHQHAYYLDEVAHLVSQAGFIIDDANEFDIDFFWKGWALRGKND